MKTTMETKKQLLVNAIIMVVAIITLFITFGSTPAVAAFAVFCYELVHIIHIYESMTPGTCWSVDTHTGERRELKEYTVKCVFPKLF